MVRKRKVNISTSREGSGRPDCVLLDAGEPEDFEGEEGIPGEGADARHREGARRAQRCLSLPLAVGGEIENGTKRQDLRNRLF